MKTPLPLRLAGMALFATLALGLVFGAHYWIFRVLVVEPALAGPWRSAGIALIALGAVSLVLQPIGERTLPRALARCIAWPASIWMGIFFYLAMGLVATELVVRLAGAPALAATVDAEPSSAAGLRALAVCTLAFLAVGAGLRRGLRLPEVRRVEIELARWPRALDGFRIAQISDIHIGPILGRAFAEGVTARVNALDADLVAVTGDLVDGNDALLAAEVAPFGELRGRHGVFFVTGNHDHYSGADAWVARVEALGMRALRNERHVIERDGAAFDLAGVEDHHAHFVGSAREDLDAALAGRDAERPVILLAHDPATFKRARTAGVDLQLSGHTHGGQIWPFVFFVRLATPWVAGLYRAGAATLYVSRGTGFWGPPMRLGAPAEITEITLRAPAP